MQDAFFRLSSLFKLILEKNRSHASRLDGVWFFQKHKKSAVNLVVKSWDSQQSDET